MTNRTSNYENSGPKGMDTIQNENSTKARLSSNNLRVLGSNPKFIVSLQFVLRHRVHEEFLGKILFARDIGLTNVFVTNTSPKR